LAKSCFRESSMQNSTEEMNLSRDSKFLNLIRYFDVVAFEPVY
jgi:hypothetical protein